MKSQKRCVTRGKKYVENKENKSKDDRNAEKFRSSEDVTCTVASKKTRHLVNLPYKPGISN